jgi:hypothetical protein
MRRAGAGREVAHCRRKLDVELVNHDVQLAVALPQRRVVCSHARVLFAEHDRLRLERHLLYRTQ